MKYKLLLLIIFILGGVLRLIGIGSTDLWRDEAFSVRAADQSIGRTVEIISEDTAPPLHSILLHYWIKIFDVGEVSVRLPSLIFGLASFILFIHLTRLVFKSKRNLIIAALLFALNPVLVYYSQEARSYSMLVFFALLSLYSTARIIQSKSISKKHAFSLFMSTILGLYTHNLFVFIAFVNFVITIIFTMDNRKIKAYLNKNKKYLLQLIGINFLAGVIYLPWFVIMIKQITTVSSGGFWLHLSPIRDPIVTIGMIFSGHYFDSSNDVNVITASVLGVIGGLLLIASTRISLMRKSPVVGGIITWLWAIMFLVWIYSFKTSFFYIRYLLFLIPAALILAVITLDRIKNLSNKMFLLILVIFVSSSSIILTAQTVHLPKSKERMSELVEDIHYQNEREDLILNADAFSQHAFVVYSDLPNYVYNTKENTPYYAGVAALNDEDYYKGTDISDYKRVWVIYLWDQRSEVTEELEGNYILTEKRDYDGNLHLELWTENEYKLN